MTVPDLSELTTEDLRTWIDALNNRYAQLEGQRAAQALQRKTDIANAIARMETLLGPDDAEAGTGNINAVRNFDAETLGANSGLALELVLAALEELTVTTLNIARVIAGDNAS